MLFDGNGVNRDLVKAKSILKESVSKDHQASMNLYYQIEDQLKRQSEANQDSIVDDTIDNTSEEIIVANSMEEVEVIIDNETLDITDPQDLQFSLSAAYPNPFNPSTSFSIDVPSSGYLTVKVFNLSGQLVEVLSSSFVNKNTYDFTWNANNMATGMYVINAEFDGQSITHNVSLIK